MKLNSYRAFDHTNRTARFWVYHKGTYVKLAVPPGSNRLHTAKDGVYPYSQVWTNIRGLVSHGEWTSWGSGDNKKTHWKQEVCALGLLGAIPDSLSFILSNGTGPGARLIGDSPRCSTMDGLGGAGGIYHYTPERYAVLSTGRATLRATPPLPAWLGSTTEERALATRVMGEQCKAWAVRGGPEKAMQ